MKGRPNPLQGRCMLAKIRFNYPAPNQPVQLPRLSGTWRSVSNVRLVRL